MFNQHITHHENEIDTRNDNEALSPPSHHDCFMISFAIELDTNAENKESEAMIDSPP